MTRHTTEETCELSYRISLCAAITIGESPAQLFMERSLGTRLERIQPDVARTVRGSQEKVEERIKSKVRTFSIGEYVMVRDYRTNHKWMPGTVSKQTGPVSYKIEIAPRNGMATSHRPDIFIRAAASCRPSSWTTCGHSEIRAETSGSSGYTTSNTRGHTS